jgi:hypothetical protein
MRNFMTDFHIKQNEEFYDRFLKIYIYFLGGPWTVDIQVYRVGFLNPDKARTELQKRAPSF